ncbi:hypothetical protein SAMN05216409_10750 [Pseudomonas lutea]|jgi:hypothetical protein|uniref:Uncharacterized protein n=1 Tax=Pseudomonas lutea TaxID=243924 RepID=A0A9X8MD32_9PSED|nr:hypothetical protein SAMN05216409_10750 [Pseudomonas lutea]
MFKRHACRPTSRLFLGTVTVRSRSDLTRFLEPDFPSEKSTIEEHLARCLRDVLVLTPIQQITDPGENDLIIDVCVKDFRWGTVLLPNMGAIDCLLLWPPKIALEATLYSVIPGAPRTVFFAEEIMTWRSYLRLRLSWKAVLNLKPAVGRQELEGLLYLACNRLLLQVRPYL